jgi:hypothetical protein
LKLFLRFLLCPNLVFQLGHIEQQTVHFSFILLQSQRSLLVLQLVFLSAQPGQKQPVRVGAPTVKQLPLPAPVNFVLRKVHDPLLDPFIPMVLLERAKHLCEQEVVT